jgi:dolichol kinase
VRGRRRDAAAERAARIMEEAQAAAERIREDARHRAERVLLEAQAAGERIRGEARARADRIRDEAQVAADRVLEEAREAAEKVRDEAPRKAIHLSSIVIPIGLLHLPPTLSRRVLIVAAVGLLVVDLVRIHHPKLRSYFTAFFGHLIRRHERETITGATYLVISALVVSMLFDVEVAAAALVYLIVGDTLAAMVGKAWGRTPVFGKSLEGFLAGFASSFAAAWALVPSLGPGPLAVGAFVAALVEILPIPVDDNFRIPLVAGLVLEWLR